MGKDFEETYYGLPPLILFNKNKKNVNNQVMRTQNLSVEGCMVKCKKKRFADKALKCTSEKYVC